MNIPNSYKRIRLRPLDKMTDPETVRHLLDNGVIVHLLEDHELPAVGFFILVRSGSRNDPPLRSGLTAIVARALRMSGTTQRTVKYINQAIDDRGASLDIGADENYVRVSAWALSKDFDFILSLAADILHHSVFSEDTIEQAIVAEKNILMRNTVGSFSHALREFSVRVNGRVSAYCQRSELDNINTITRDDVVAYHKRHFHPGNILVGAWGDFEAHQAFVSIQNTFGAWTRRNNIKDVPEVEPILSEPVSISLWGHANPSNLNNIPRTWIMMGGLGCGRHSIEHGGLAVAVHILQSRLYQVVRSDNGLAYLVGARLNAGWDHTGTWIAFANTNSSSLNHIQGIIANEIDRMQHENLCDAELERARRCVQTDHGFDHAVTSSHLERIVLCELFGYEDGEYLALHENIASISRSDVLRASRQFMHSGNVKTLII